MEIAESLLHEKLSHLSRRLHNRVDASVMTEEVIIDHQFHEHHLLPEVPHFHLHELGVVVEQD